MKKLRSLTIALALLLPRLVVAQAPDTNSPAALFGEALRQVSALFAVRTNAPPFTFTAGLKIVKANGLPKDLVGREFKVALQAPDRLRLSVAWEGQDVTIGRDQEVVWVYEPGKKFGLLGTPRTPPFSTRPDYTEGSALGPLALPLRPEQMFILPLLLDYQTLSNETVGGVACRVFKATPRPEAMNTFKLPRVGLQVWLREADSFPLRVAYQDAKGAETQIECIEPSFDVPWPEGKWRLPAAEGDKIETVARSHLTRFFSVAFDMLGEKIPTLGPATGQRQVVAREGNGRLELVDGTRVLYLKGTPEEMGRQQGTLLKPEIRRLVDRILYGVGVGSSFEKGRWFFGEIESAQKRLTPYMDERYDREMDALADASGCVREEVRLANFFPELFHCSGFALFGKATQDGRMYHGRILDYLRGMGLEQNAVVMVFQPDQGNAWVNISYAGFIGSVTAMNAKHIAMGEMGGRGEGNWDGKPMAELVREVMERANTLDEAVEIMRKGPRTCQYYYVISDGKTKRAVGIAATPDKFETIWPGQSHPLLPHAIPDAVVLSAGDRYEELVRRVQADYGKLTPESARDLMKRPVCMTSNIHAVLFAPDTLDFWVANADSQNPAAHTRYTHYNLGEMLQPEKPPQAASNGSTQGGR